MRMSAWVLFRELLRENFSILKIWRVLGVHFI